ncbi:mitochondrial carrier domain-containing protein [Plectosphaerella cucumerina]|jgi:solute carrier family 25 S-adenosylmethionine transporter 26|uniref:Mitochondrial carrier domain-containing protein n=1 Tax=Plectosphaerella cucumerina TaxID=40658 RepID=A0A8K0X548_9PEZI|nr:mitochondrial carrier domain-containing protein [Plectosphaerella cucumerina]
MSSTSNPPFTTALIAGGLAGTTVDLSLFPLDTLKTRLQSRAGFFPSGGFSGIYRGVGSAIIGSSPGAALFFCTYERTKSLLRQQRAGASSPPSRAREAAEHMLAGSLGEIAACSVRVPTEVVKQRAQAGQHSGSSAQALRSILSLRASAGFGAMWRELYRGWGITVMREVPFTIIQFPIWERLKAWGRARRARKSGTTVETEVGAVESAAYGSLSGAIAAASTTPLDVLKTRIMLSEKKVRVGEVVKSVLREEGWRAFFKGTVPRVTWISIGGAIFLGSYQFTVNTLTGGQV